jgi:hypothetical protein
MPSAAIHVLDFVSIYYMLCLLDGEKEPERKSRREGKSEKGERERGREGERDRARRKKERKERMN